MKKKKLETFSKWMSEWVVPARPMFVIFFMAKLFQFFVKLYACLYDCECVCVLKMNESDYQEDNDDYELNIEIEIENMKKEQEQEQKVVNEWWTKKRKKL